MLPTSPRGRTAAGRQRFRACVAFVDSEEGNGLHDEKKEKEELSACFSEPSQYAKKKKTWRRRFFFFAAKAGSERVCVFMYDTCSFHFCFFRLPPSFFSVSTYFCVPAVLTPEFQ
jgi:hypothetical protein